MESVHMQAQCVKGVFSHSAIGAIKLGSPIHSWILIL